MLKIISFLLFVAISNGQDDDDDDECDYTEETPFSGDAGASFFTRDGSNQYVVFDFGFTGTPTDFEKGGYFLPFVFTNDDKSASQCHSWTFSSSAYYAFSCSTGYEDGSETDDTIVTATFYTDSACTTEQGLSYWWQKGYSPYYNPLTGIPVPSQVCDSVATCEALLLTRDEVTQYTGSRYDFSCTGDVNYGSAKLCFDAQCSSVLCSTVYAAIGASCIATPTYGWTNLLASCTDEEVQLTSFVDENALAVNQTWRTYDQNRICSTETDTGFVCRSWAVGTTCSPVEGLEIQDTQVYGVMDKCTKPYSDASFIKTSFALFFITFCVTFLQV